MNPDSPSTPNAIDDISDPYINNATATVALASDLSSQDFTEAPPLDSLHIDEIEPPSPSSNVAVSPLAPVPANSNFRGPRASKSSRSNRGGQKQSSETTRARAEEVNSGSKLVPKIEEEVGDFFRLEIEISAWFNECFSGPDLDNWVHELEVDYKQNRESLTEVRRLLYDVLIHRSAPSVSSALKSLLSRTNNVESSETGARPWWLTYAEQPTKDLDTHTLVFICLCGWVSSPDCKPLLANGIPMLSGFLKQIASMRFFVEFEERDTGETRLLSRLFLLTRMATLATLGDSQDVKEAQATVWKKYGLEPPEHEDEYASPIKYAEFVEEISQRYPECVTQEDDMEHWIGSRLRRGKLASSRLNSAEPSPSFSSFTQDGTYDPAEPRDLVSSSSSVMPYVPESILEAYRLYRSRVKAVPALLQLHEVQESGALIGWKDALGDVDWVQAVRDLYSGTVKVQKSIVRVVVDFIVQTGSAGPSPGIHAALASIWHLLQWFRVGHVLMFEHFAALLFDCQFHLVAHLFCSEHPRVTAYIMEPYQGGERFWSLVTSRATEYDGPALSWSSQDMAELTVPHFNSYELQTYTHFIGISRLMVSGKTQRLLVVADLPVDPLKSLFSVYEHDLWQQLLQYVKAQVPFTGRRWRYLNMELISAIYLYCPSGIDDNWLSGKDISQSVRNASTEEAALRDLIEEFNGNFQ